MKRLLFLIPILALAACTDPDAATRALDNLGFTDIKTEGYAIWSCMGKEYLASTKFSATNPKGKTVTGAVCSGPFTGSSIKFD